MLPKNGCSLQEHFPQPKTGLGVSLHSTRPCLLTIGGFLNVIQSLQMFRILQKGSACSFSESSVVHPITLLGDAAMLPRKNHLLSDVVRMGRFVSRRIPLNRRWSPRKRDQRSLSAHIDTLEQRTLLTASPLGDQFLV